MDTKSSGVQAPKSEKNPDPIVDKSKLTSFRQKPPQTSRLPWVIEYNRKKAALLFKHARSKEHGLKHIDIRKGMLALFWIVTFISVMAILIYMVVDLCKRFASNPVATQIKAEQDGILFPDISVCAKAPFHVNAKPNQSDPTRDLLIELSEQITQKLRDSSIKLTKSSTEASLLIQMATRQEFVHLRYLQCFTFSPNARIISGGRGLQFIYYKSHRDDKPFMMLNDLEDEAFQTESYDGIHVLVHNPGTFPTYKISSMPTSFSLRFGQQAHIEVSGLNYRSDMSGRKSCIVKADDYKYTNFRGGANYLEYRYTFEDCVANMKQRWIRQQCDCFSDDLFVPFQSAEEEALRREEYNSDIKFCRDIREKTSQVIREQFLCYEQYEKMPTTTVLDQFVDADKLFNTREDLDARKILRHQVCSLPCEKQIYLTKFFEINDMDPKGGFPASILSTYIEQLRESRLQNEELQAVWKRFRKGSNKKLLYKNTILIEIRAASERIDAWEEELTESLFNLISNLGGTLGLCAGISFLSSFFLLIFFGRAFVHALISFVLWFWWAVYLAKPPTPDRDIEKHPNSSTSGGTISVSSSNISRMTESKASKLNNPEPKIKEYQHMVEKTGDTIEPEAIVNVEKVETSNPNPDIVHEVPPPILPTAPPEVAPITLVTKHAPEQRDVPILKSKPSKNQDAADEAPPQQKSAPESKSHVPQLVKAASKEEPEGTLKTIKEQVQKRIPPILKISRTSSRSKSEEEGKEDEEEADEEPRKGSDTGGEEEEDEEVASTTSDEVDGTSTSENKEDYTNEDDETQSTASTTSTATATTTQSDEWDNNAAKNLSKNSYEWQNIPEPSKPNMTPIRKNKEKGWYRQSVPETKEKWEDWVQPSPVKKINRTHVKTSNEQTTPVQPSPVKKTHRNHMKTSSEQMVPVQPSPVKKINRTHVKTSNEQTTPLVATKTQRRPKHSKNIETGPDKARKFPVDSSASDKDPFGLIPLRRSSISFPFDDESAEIQPIRPTKTNKKQHRNRDLGTMIPIPPKLRTYSTDQNQKIYAFEDDETYSPPMRTLVDQKLVPGYIESLYMRSNPYSVPRQ